MPKFFVRQPDSKFALFSTVVDDFLYCGLTEEGALRVAKDDLAVTPSQADELIGQAKLDEPFRLSENRGDGLNRWRHTLTALAIRHGVRVLVDRMNEMGLKEAAIPSEAIKAAEDQRRGTD